MPSYWTSYEPGPGGKGYTLYDQNDKPQLFAPTPSLDALLPSLKPRGDYLANNGAGGTSGSADPSQNFAGPPAQVADVGPQMSSTPEPVSRAPEAPAAPTTAAAGRPRARLAGPEAPGGGDAPAGGMSPEERQLRAVEDIEMQRAGTRGYSPVVRTPEHWQDKTRSVEGRMVDPAALAEWEAAQADERQMRGLMADSMAEANAKAEEERKAATEKENELAARKDAEARKYQEDQLRLEAEIEAERKALKNPNDYWEGLGTGGQVGATILMALGGLGEAIKGGDGSKIAGVFQSAIERHAQSRMRNVAMLDAQRGRNHELHKTSQARLEAERAQAIKAADDRIKGILADGANPIVRELVYEDVPPSEAKKAAAVAIVRTLRKGIPGANMDEADIKKSADEYIRTMTPQEKALVFTTGPDGELVPKENVRRYAAEYEFAKARLDTARERLGYADKFAASQRLNSEFIPERVTGGGGGPDLKTIKGILKDRLARGEKVSEADLKRAEISGKIDERREAKAEKEGARTFVLGGQEYTARAGTSPEAVRSFQDKAALLASAQAAAKEIKDTSWGANKAGSKNLEVNVRSLAAAANTLYGQGAMTTDDLNWFNETLRNTNWTTADGKDAASKLVQRLEDVQRGWIGQVGAKPKGAR